MKEALAFISQINSCRKAHNELQKNFEASLGLIKKQDADALDFYAKNEPQYYVLLRCLYDFEDYLSNQRQTLTVKEETYFYNLYRYGRALLKVIKFFPRLTYYLWQKSIGAYSEPFYDQMFNRDRNVYAMLADESSNALRQVKMSY